MSHRFIALRPTLLPALLIGALGHTTAAYPGTAFSENFGNFPYTNVNGAGLSQLYSEPPTVCYGGNPGPDSKYGATGVPPGTLDKWGFFASPYYQNYQSWQGFGPTQTWAVGYSYGHSTLAVHAGTTPYDGGFALFSGATFDRSKYITATANLRMYCLNNADGCFAGLTLLASENDYREIGLISLGGQANVRTVRLAPCEGENLVNASGQTLTFGANTWVTLRIDYLGPEGGGWKYQVNGQPAMLQAGNTFVEGPTYYNSALAANPRLGIYFTAPSGLYSEGGIDDVNVYVLD